MNGGSGKTQSSGQQDSWSQSHIEVPQWLEPLARQSASNVGTLQRNLPLGGSQQWIANAGATPVYSKTAQEIGAPGGGGQIDVHTADAQGYYPVSNADGSISFYKYGDVTAAGQTPNFLASNPMQIAGVNPLQTLAAEQTKQVGAKPANQGTAEQFAALAPILAGKMATGAGVGTDPAVLAASAAFEKLLAPGIENQMGLSGLGKSSSLANALASGKTQYMLPLIQDYINREQSTLTNQANMYGSMAGQFANLGVTDTSRLLSGINAENTMGGVLRGIEQEPLTAKYQDFLRLQALAEQALYGPFGATATASIGPNATSESHGTQSGSGSQSAGMMK